MTDVTGARIADYVLHEQLLARDSEIAYRATHRVLPRCARLTILRPAFLGVRRAELQLMREACVLETLHHSGVPRVFECGVFERRPWVASEYVTGASIEEVAAVGPLPISDAIAVIRDAAEILAHAHRRGVVHRGITPSAILRTADRGFPLCMLHWGQAAIHGSAPPADGALGAPFYRAPELATGDPGGSAADVFALGAVVYEAATLVLPDPVEKFPGVPESFHQLLASMLSAWPEERPTAAAVHAAAARLAELYADGDPAIEEVEVELIDISRTQTPTLDPVRTVPTA